jgi:hypothetical protein
MQDKTTPEYAAKIKATEDLMNKLCKELVDKNARIAQTKKAQKLLRKFAVRLF